MPEVKKRDEDIYKCIFAPDKDSVRLQCHSDKLPDFKARINQKKYKHNQ